MNQSPKSDCNHVLFHKQNVPAGLRNNRTDPGYGSRVRLLSVMCVPLALCYLHIGKKRGKRAVLSTAGINLHTEPSSLDAISHLQMNQATSSYTKQEHFSIRFAYDISKLKDGFQQSEENPVIRQGNDASRG